MDASKSVTATFEVRRTLTVNKDGAGQGTVTSSPDGINCGGTCSVEYISGTGVTLTAHPSPGSEFAGWSVDCSGTGSCPLTMDQNHTVTATFTASQPPTCPGFETDPRNQVVGTSVGDLLVGTSGKDVICGLTGKDELRGAGGADLIVGGGGNDIVKGGSGADKMKGEGGADRLLGGAGRDSASGGPGKDFCRAEVKRSC
jgi:Ca2+-binding RTX toxin-like protein